MFIVILVNDAEAQNFRLNQFSRFIILRCYRRIKRVWGIGGNHGSGRFCGSWAGSGIGCLGQVGAWAYVERIAPGHSIRNIGRESDRRLFNRRSDGDPFGRAFHHARDTVIDHNRFSWQLDYVLDFFYGVRGLAVTRPVRMGVRPYFEPFDRFPADDGIGLFDYPYAAAVVLALIDYL